MQTNRPARRARGQEQIPFASWLDSMIPALFANDADFARALGVNQSQVHRWRRGVVPQLNALVKMSKLTKTDIETLAQIAGYQPDTEKGNS